MLQPLVSVVIPNYNRSAFLGQTLECLMAQTFPNWEALVVDDGSSDGSQDVACAYQSKDSRIKFFQREREPAGAPTCRNIGTQNAQGQFLIFLDSDDLLAPFCLENRVNAFMQDPELDFAVFPMLVFSDDPKNATHYWNLPSATEPDLQRFLRLDAVWQTTGPMWKREAVLSLGGFTEGLACWQDVDFHLKALIKGLKYRHIFTEPDSYYRRHISGSVSQGEISTPPKLKARLHVFVDHVGQLAQEARIDKELRKKLQFLGANVVFGSLKVHQWRIAARALTFGFRKRIFGLRFMTAAMFLAMINALRLSRLSSLQKLTTRLTDRWRVAGTIGQYPYHKTNNH